MPPDHPGPPPKFHGEQDILGGGGETASPHALDRAPIFYRILYRTGRNGLPTIITEA
jgi:hypothetical protein